MPRIAARALTPLAWSCWISTAPGPAAADPAPPALRGDVSHDRLEASEVFPGTVRDSWIYLPARSRPEVPACLYVNQDNLEYDASAVFDALIRKKEIPALIAVLVTPGKVPASSGDALDRFNRSIETEGLGDVYAGFLAEELLPEVETRHARDGRPIRLSKNGDDRSIGGEHLDVLFATCGERVYKRKLKVKGILSFEAPVKPSPPRL